MNVYQKKKKLVKQKLPLNLCKETHQYCMSIITVLIIFVDNGICFQKYIHVF